MLRTSTTRFKRLGFLVLGSLVLSVLYNRTGWWAYELLMSDLSGYFMPSAPDLRLFCILLLVTIETAILLIIIGAFWPRRWSAHGYVFACLAYVMVIYRIAMGLPVLSALPPWIADGLLYLGIVPLLVTVGVRKPAVVQSALRVIVVGCLGFLLAKLGVASFRHDWRIVSSDYTTKPLYGSTTTRSAPRVERIVWVVFDEFDYVAAFEHRPDGVSLPALDRLRGQALFATHAHPPGLWTLDAMPAYLLGRPLREVRPQSISSLLLFPSPAGPTTGFDAKQSLPFKLHRLGARVAVAGWYHPYCRLLREVPCDCSWEPSADANSAILFNDYVRKSGASAGISFLVQVGATDLLPSFLRDLAFPGLSSHLQEAAEHQHAAAVQSLLLSGLSVASNANYDFVFLHLPVPHPPGVNHRLPLLEALSSSGIPYYDNVRLLDRFVARLRESMERAGLWDSTHLILSSDHPLRESVWRDRKSFVGPGDLLNPGDRGRVQVIVKLRRDESGLEYSEPFNSILLHDLCLQLAQGRIAALPDLKLWLARARTQFPLVWSGKTISGQSF